MKKLLSILLLSGSLYSASAQSSIANGAVCPNITITDTKGTVHKLYDYCTTGKYVLIDFFAYWCGPCKATAPTIEAFYKKYGCNSGNVIVLGNECDAAGSLALLHGFETSAGLDPVNTYPSTYGMLGGAANGTTYGVGAYPTIILVGPDKKMINNDIWPISAVADIESKFPAGVLAPKACAPTSISENEMPNLSVSPNPVKNLLLVKCSGITDIIIYNQLGTPMLSLNDLQNIDNKSIDLSHLSQGLYMIDVKTIKGNAVTKFYKN